jgi:hypothetical protein
LVEFDGQPVDQSLDAITRLVDRFELNSRQATYLELAQRRDLPLVTLDPRLGTEASRLVHWLQRVLANLCDIRFMFISLPLSTDQAHRILVLRHLKVH